MLVHEDMDPATPPRVHRHYGPDHTFVLVTTWDEAITYALGFAKQPHVWSKPTVKSVPYHGGNGKVAGWRYELRTELLPNPNYYAAEKRG